LATDGEDKHRGSLIAAIAHPGRRRILRIVATAGEARSPAQMAKAMSLPQGMVAYHARVLWRLGAVEPASERMVRGAVEHFYDTTIEDDPPIEALLEETREVDEAGE
jgi:DNA-binding transcriptional ArsR family regulator